VAKKEPKDFSSLSGQLESFIESLDRDNEDGDEALTPDERAGFEKLIRLAARSLEGFSESWARKLFDVLREDADTWRWAVDDFYSREAVDNIGGIVRRFLRLSPVLVGIIPSKDVSLYLREATRCYIYGFFEATTALSRAAVEAGLNEYLKRRLGSVPSQKLMEKVKSANAWKLLTSASAGMAEEVAKAAGMVLHQRPAKSEGLAFDTLVRARGLLLELYQE